MNDASEGQLRRGIGHVSHELGEQLPVIIALVIIVLVGWTESDHFMTPTNLTNVLGRIGPLAIIAVGTAIVMIAGEIDLSIGSTVSFVSIIAAKGANSGTPTILVVFECMAGGATIGVLIGLVVAFTRASSFMVTLGALSVISGAAAAWTHNSPVTISQGFVWLGVDQVGPIPNSILILAGVIAAAYFFLHRLRAGRRLYALGGNEEAARLVGVRTDAVRVMAFAINGLLVGLGSAILTSVLGSGDPTTGVGLELQIIAAVIIGGATLAGGHGSLLGALLGVALLTVISNVLDLVGAESYVSTMVFGAFIILAVALRGSRTQTAARRVAAVVQRGGPTQAPNEPAREVSPSSETA